MWVRFPLIFAALLWPSSLLAEPCEVASFDQPLPGATQVQWRYADVPSARFPNAWQEGRYEGFSYKIFPDGQAVLAANLQRPSWKIELTCDKGKTACDYQNLGDVPEGSKDVAESLGKCLLGLPDTAAAEQVIEATTVETVPENTGNCEATRIPEGGTVISLQRLLVIAGADPGPVDGFIGPATRDALASVLTEIAPETDLTDAVDQLRKFICAR